MLVTVRRPYEAYWDNILSIILSLQLVLIMLCGMALEMNRLTPELASDPYEKSSFGMLMVAFSIVIIVTALGAIVVTIPCLRDRVAALYVKYTGTVSNDLNNEENLLGNNNNVNVNNSNNHEKIEIEMKQMSETSTPYQNPMHNEQKNVDTINIQVESSNLTKQKGDTAAIPQQKSESMIQWENNEASREI